MSLSTAMFHMNITAHVWHLSVEEFNNVLNWFLFYKASSHHISYIRRDLFFLWLHVHLFHSSPLVLFITVNLLAASTIREFTLKDVWLFARICMYLFYLFLDIPYLFIFLGLYLYWSSILGVLQQANVVRYVSQIYPEYAPFSNANCFSP